MNVFLKRKKSKLFPYLLALSFFFLLLQLCAFITATASLDFLTIAHQDQVTHVPLSAVLPIILWLLLEIALTLIFTVLIWGMIRLIGRLLHWKWEKTCRLGFYLWLVAIITVITANQLSSPASTFNQLVNVVIPPALSLPLLIMGCAILFFSALLAALALIDMLMPRKFAWRFMMVILIFLGATSLEINHYAYAHSQPIPITEPTQPNIIIIGLDSLRPDFTGFMGKSNLTPNLNRFLQNATFFDNTTTPLARTFPSWTGMLTGLDPVDTGVRYNLTQQQALNFPHSFARILQQHGYYTVYATDDRRFSNITPKYGFDAVISPPDGVDDFLVGTINDLPLSNLLLDSPAGKYLFPYNYGNRAAYTNYHPHTFNEMVEDRLVASNAQHKPMLIIVHFCLPHWPYAWAKQDYQDDLFPIGLYKLAVQRSDIQTEQYINFLTTHHYLDHAIVIVLSDHGEGLMLPSDRMVANDHFVKGPHSDPNILQKMISSMKIGNISYDNSYGHGSDALTFPQFHTVLAFKTMGLNYSFTPGHISAPTTTLDLNATILSLLHIPLVKTDGISLAEFLYHPNLANSLNNRFRFTETGFSPSLLKDGIVRLDQVTLPSKDLYLVNPSNTIGLNPVMAQKMIPLKQRAVLYHNWVLALYPHDYQHSTAVLVNRTTGQWTDDLQSHLAKQAPVTLLLAALEKMYGSEVTGKYPFS